MFEQTIRNFKINFIRHDGRNNFSSGDQIIGHISFDLTKETKITSITMRLKGNANVRLDRRRRWRETGNEETLLCKAGLLRLKRSYFARRQGYSWDKTSTRDACVSVHMSAPTRAPLSGSNSVTPCSLWCNSSPVTLTVSVATKAFTPGETVKIFCEFSNSSSKTATPKVKLQQKQTFYTHSKRNRKMAIKTLACVSGEPVGAQVSYVRTEIMLAIPSSASLTISECSILVVDYIIEVKLHVGALDEVVVLFPIILCDTPVQTYPPV
ncbi:arrestin domain-containing protein 3-like [Simochromis diagramma]|uniref:arrestin domain-containing protein 3-like n=1 Tax=Simochromis diagramma TaxID=43689 RepID=UPI001A7ECD14|nr:arrestin domain-containing protein 3-like [Simochromis diagramma]